MSISENMMWELAKAHGATILAENGRLLVGRITWVGDYTIGFIPDDTQIEIGSLGMVPGKESVVYKSFIRAVTPNVGRSDERKTGTRGTGPVSGLQPLAPSNRRRRT